MIKKGSFEVSQGDFQNMLNWVSAPLNKDKYEKAYFNLQSDSLHAVASMGEQAVSYCTFGSPFVNDINLHDSVEDTGMESLINHQDVKEYLEFVGGKNVTVSFYGDEDDDICSKMEIDGDLTITIYLPSSQTDYEAQQTGIVDVYDDDERWCRPSNGEHLDTQFTTRVSEFERIVKAKEFEDFAMSTYPVVIEDGEFILNAVDDNDRNSVSGNLYSEDVEGPGVRNTYSRGFSELFNSISGDVRVDIEQDTPMSVVRQSNDAAMTLRYTLLPTA